MFIMMSWINTEIYPSDWLYRNSNIQINIWENEWTPSESTRSWERAVFVCCPLMNISEKKSASKRLSKTQTNPVFLSSVFSFLTGRENWERPRNMRARQRAPSQCNVHHQSRLFPFPSFCFYTKWTIYQKTKTIQENGREKKKTNRSEKMWWLRHCWFCRPWYCHSVVYFSSP